MGCSPANVAHQSMMNSHAAKRTTVEVELFAGRLVKDQGLGALVCSDGSA